jgi:DinB superfamily
MSNELILDSLRRRFRAMHSLYEDATATMTLEQVNHREKARVMPIAFSLFHYVNMQDASFMILSGEPFICNEEILDAINPSIRDHGKHKTVEEMDVQQIGNYEAFIDYMNKVFARTEKWLAQLDPAELNRVLLVRPFGPAIENTYSARVAGPDGLTVLDGIECWLYQHGLRHMGEIELARGFVGLEGMTS